MKDAPVISKPTPEKKVPDGTIDLIYSPEIKKGPSRPTPNAPKMLDPENADLTPDLNNRPDPPAEGPSPDIYCLIHYLIQQSWERLWERQLRLKRSMADTTEIIQTLDGLVED
jgi:hypothetical protein